MGEVTLNLRSSEGERVLEERYADVWVRTMSRRHQMPAVLAVASVDKNGRGEKTEWACYVGAVADNHAAEVEDLDWRLVRNWGQKQSPEVGAVLFPQFAGLEYRR